MVEEGHHALTRLGRFDTEILWGITLLSSIYTSYLNSACGNLGSIAVFLFGSQEIKLNKKDLVFIDIGCGVESYHFDKTPS